jgi:uncharacterized Zn finger protein (UPF0148 family)
MPEDCDDPACAALCPECGSPLEFCSGTNGHGWYCSVCEAYVREEQLETPLKVDVETVLEIEDVEEL